MKRIVITGPTGAIGHALIERLLADGCEIYAICRPGSIRIKSLPRNNMLHIIEIDLSELGKAALMLPPDCEVLYHFGWVGTFGDVRNNMSLQVKNIQYTLDAVKLAKDCGCSVFIGAGSQAEYGRIEGKLHPDTPAFPENGYGMAKLCAGQMSRVEARKLGIKHIWTRILSVYGPYDGENTMVMSTISKLIKGEKPSFTKGEQQWDYLYSKDAAGIMQTLAEKGIDGKIYCLGSGKTQPLKKYIEVIRDNVNPQLSLGLGDISYSEKQVMYLCADTTNIITDLHYEYKYTFLEGICETIAWAKEKFKTD